MISGSSLKEELQLDGKIVLALGRMAKNKGYDLLIQAMKPVFERVPDARLLLAVGSSDPPPEEIEQIEELRKLAKDMGIADRVLFHDYIPDDYLADFYRAADVFALSSRYEPFGMTAVEAMACGTPTIVTTEGGLWDQVSWGNDALYANPFDPEAFGHGIAKILMYPEVFHRLARNGSQTARAKFTWTGIAQQLLRQVEQVPGDKSSHPEPQPEFDEEPEPVGAGGGAAELEAMAACKVKNYS